jgi:hypothetical protein
MEKEVYGAQMNAHSDEVKEGSASFRAKVQSPDWSQKVQAGCKPGWTNVQASEARPECKSNEGFESRRFVLHEHIHQHPG